jgi:hypothetical protein
MMVNAIIRVAAIQMISPKIAAMYFMVFGGFELN